MAEEMCLGEWVVGKAFINRLLGFIQVLFHFVDFIQCIAEYVSCFLVCLYEYFIGDLVWC